MSPAYAPRVTFGLIWDTSFIHMKWATALISPMQLVFMCVFFGFLSLALILGGVVLAHTGRRKSAPSLADHPLSTARLAKA